MDTEEKVYVPDTSALIEELISKMIKDGKIKGKIVVHRAAIAELENQANQNKPIGFLGLDELKLLNEMAKKGELVLEYEGSRPAPQQIKFARLGEIDALIRDYAWENNLTLITCDYVQAEAGKASGMNVMYIEKRDKYGKKLKIESFFDHETMSVHLRSGVKPLAKRGVPGAWTFKELKDKELDEEEVKDIALEIVEAAKMVKDAFIEMERRGSTIVQFGDYRIVICRPPFSDAWEITAVHPLVKLSLKDYSINKQILDRLDSKAEGIIIAGSPGMGKTTFAQALAEHYHKKGKLVKTVEAPRDLQVSKEITQYSKNLGTPTEIRDILLLTRPDYTIFDEMRDTDDFRLYSDMRLAGVGMVGVVHASGAIDAVQRFIGRLDLGVIPSVIDTVIFVKNGNIDKILSLRMVVKVPYGMIEKDLSRPVIEIRDYLTDVLEHEIYVFGEETVVVPVKRHEVDPDIAEKISRRIKNAKVEIKDGVAYVYVDKKMIPKIIGRQGTRIRDLEKEMGISIQVDVL